MYTFMDWKNKCLANIKYLSTSIGPLLWYNMKIMDRLSHLSFFHLWRSKLVSRIHADLLTSLCCHGPLVLDSVSELSSNEFITEQKK